MQLTLFAPETGSRPASSSGKTCRAYSIPKTTPSDAFWADWPEKICRLNRQGKNGRTQVVCLDTNAASRGASLTHNISECPNAAAASSLSQVLETQTPQKYFLSDTSKQGILQRAQRHGKTLPPLLLQDDPANPPPTLNQSGCGGIIGQSNQEIFSQRGGGLIPVRMRGFGDYVQDNTVSTVKARDHKDATDLIVVNGRQAPCVSDKAFTLDCQHNGNTNVVCIHGNTIGRQLHNGGNGTGATQDGTNYTLTTTGRHAVSDGLQVRRLTPAECERLQGFPDNHTQIPWRGKPAADCPDSPRYKAIGNSMAVPVMRWIGERICRMKDTIAAILIAAC